MVVKGDTISEVFEEHSTQETISETITGITNWRFTYIYRSINTTVGLIL